MELDLNDPNVKAEIDKAVKAQIDTATKTAVDSEVQGLKNKNDELMGKLKSATDSKGITDTERDKLKEFEKAALDAKEKEHIDKGEYEKLKEQIIAKHGEEIVVKDEMLKSMKASLYTHLLEGEALKSIASANATKLLLPHVLNNLEVKEEDGKYVARVVDSLGTVRIGDDKGTPMTIDQLVTSFKEDNAYLGAFNGTNASGGGAAGSGNGNNSKNVMLRSAFETLNPVEKSEFMKGGGKLTDE